MFENFPLAKQHLEIAAQIAAVLADTQLRDEWYS